MEDVQVRDIADRYDCYRLFQLYYQGDVEKGAEILTKFTKYSLDTAAAGQETAGITGESVQEIEYDYNRLFIGPEKPLAPPYASVYLNEDGLVMQAETIAVRNFYRAAGLEVREKNSVPDDALPLELEFICYLLRQIAFSAERGRFTAMFRDFFTRHFLLWIQLHLSDAQRNAKTEFCRTAAVVMRRFFAAEKQRFNDY